MCLSLDLPEAHGSDSHRPAPQCRNGKKKARVSGRRGLRLLGPDGQESGVRAWLSKLAAGNSVGLLYEGDDLWHERYLLYPLESAGRWYIRTPDGDVYIEDLSCRLADGADRAFCCSPAGDTPRVAQGKFYRFVGYPGKGAMALLVFEARALVRAAAEEEAADPKDAVDVSGVRRKFAAYFGVANTSVVVAGAQSPTPASNGQKMNTSFAMNTPDKDDPNVDEDGEPVVEPAGEGTEEADKYVWLPMEKAFGLDMFAHVDMKASDLRAGDRGVFKVGLKQFVSVCRVLKEDMESNRPVFQKTGKTEELDDARLLGPMAYDVRGVRWLP